MDFFVWIKNAVRNGRIVDIVTKGSLDVWYVVEDSSGGSHRLRGIDFQPLCSAADYESAREEFNGMKDKS